MQEDTQNKLDMVQQDKLEQILRERIKRKHIKRWKKVSVYDYNSCPDWVMQLTQMRSDEITIHWNGKQRGNIHSYELKTAKSTEIDNLIRRNTERLKSERPIYK